MDAPDKIIEEHIYLGSFFNANNIIDLVNYDIGYIINVGDVKSSAKYPENIKTLYRPLSDFGNSDLVSVFDECFQIFDEAKKNNKKVLIHCVAGVNRSVSVLIAYLMQHKKWKLKEALQFVKEKRSYISPHPGYIRQLQEYEKQLFKDTSTNNNNTTS
eukprot:TRINITY_DN3678_c0_g2_i1.p1 TRINITY_DN3678_c0_g2~~TRINITY_DN3678_c0_g2_i1.p1  ORF type:complete len:158 (+),score=14.10 TRINITY_DN3678_c0_g2_i1:11-484(+)